MIKEWSELTSEEAKTALLDLNRRDVSETGYLTPTMVKSWISYHNLGGNPELTAHLQKIGVLKPPKSPLS